MIYNVFRVSLLSILFLIPFASVYGAAGDALDIHLQRYNNDTIWRGYIDSNDLQCGRGRMRMLTGRCGNPCTRKNNDWFVFQESYSERNSDVVRDRTTAVRCRNRDGWQWVNVMSLKHDKHDNTSFPFGRGRCSYYKKCSSYYTKSQLYWTGSKIGRCLLSGKYSLSYCETE